MGETRFELRSFGIERSIKLNVGDKPISHYIIDIDSGIIKVVYTDGTSNRDAVKNVDEPKKVAMTGVVMPEDKNEEVESEVNPATVTKEEGGVAKEAETAGEPVSEEAAKADAHRAGDAGGATGTVSATGVANEPNVVVSGGTPTVDGKKPTRSRKTTG